MWYTGHMIYVNPDVFLPSVKVFLCPRYCGLEVLFLFSAKPVRNCCPLLPQHQLQMHFLHIPTKLWRFVWQPQAGVNLPMGSLFALVLLSVSLSLSLSFKCIHPSPSPSLSLFLPFLSSYSTRSVETVKSICFGDTFTGCPCWTMTSGSKLGPNLSHDLKWQIN